MMSVVTQNHPVELMRCVTTTLAHTNANAKEGIDINKGIAAESAKVTNSFL